MTAAQSSATLAGPSCWRCSLERPLGRGRRSTVHPRRRGLRFPTTHATASEEPFCMDFVRTRIEHLHDAQSGGCYRRSALGGVSGEQLHETIQVDQERLRQLGGKILTNGVLRAVGGPSTQADAVSYT